MLEYSFDHVHVVLDTKLVWDRRCARHILAYPHATQSGITVRRSVPPLGELGVASRLRKDAGRLLERDAVTGGNS